MSRARAADDYDIIRTAMIRIRDDAIPKCPVAEGRRLYECLRSVARCGVSCPHKDDWIGPDGDK